MSTRRRIALLRRVGRRRASLASEPFTGPVTRSPYDGRTDTPPGTATDPDVLPFRAEIAQEDLYGLADSPVALAAWMLDHDARSYEDIVRAFDGDPIGDLTRDELRLEGSP